MDNNNEQQKDKLWALRHSAEHVLTLAMLRLWPGKIKAAMGPATDDGFYFDFDSDIKISESDFEKIEKEMAKIIKEDLPFIADEMEVKEAREFFNSNVYKGNEYKHEWLDEIKSRGEKVSVYWMGEKGKDVPEAFIDICSGPHAQSTSKIGAFKLTKIAGAYWRGDEKNKMLQRIYGTAFEKESELKAYLEYLKEAERRDHRKLGKELEIFALSEEVGPGLPLWLPNGMIIREELEKWGKETERKWGYKRVGTPFMTKKRLFEISGHVPYFEDEMYKVKVPGDDEEDYFIKPMNCPFHHMIYKSKKRSYRDLPLKLAEYGTVARYENSGAINGILRPRVFCQNDAHIYCTEEQVVDEFVKIINLHRYYYDKLGLKDYYIILELRDPEKKDKYHGDEEMWQKSEKLSIEAMDKAGIKYVVRNEGAAHYGPKMDFKIKSTIGTEYGISTNQIDFFMPKQFNLTYTDKDGQEKLVVVQHQAPLGSNERFIGFLIEHFAGAFPLWLSPVQIVLISVGESHKERCQKLAEELGEKDLRVEVWDEDETVGNKIRKAVGQKIPYMLVIGDKEISSPNLHVRKRGEKDVVEIPKEKFVEDVLEEIKDKK